MTPTISSLLSRVRAASGPDQALDRDICTAFRITWCVPVTDSLDAAVALVERELPETPKGWGWTITRDDDHFQGPTIYWAAVRTLERLPVAYRARGQTPPLAILDALLSAINTAGTHE